MDRSKIITNLKQTLHNHHHIVGPVVGSGMMAKYTAQAGADLFLALSAGKYRLRGRSSVCSYLPIGNSNDLVMNFGTKELLPILADKPVIFGLNANDPTIHLYEYIKDIQNKGFSGIVNFPTMTLIDGMFRENLEAHNNSFKNEVEAIKIAHYCNLFTIAFVTNIAETKAMLEVGCDCICVHLGFTKGGSLGVSQAISLAKAKEKAENIFNYVNKTNDKVFKVIYGGPISTVSDMEYIYKNSSCDGLFGGSAFDRIPIEQVIIDTTKQFKNSQSQKENLHQGLLDNTYNSDDFVEFVKNYVKNNYSKKVLLSDIASLIHVSTSYLSNLFAKKEKISFTQYLINYRMNKSKELLLQIQVVKEVASEVGFSDAMQFSKMFKKHIGITPSAYIKNNINTCSYN